MKRNMMAAGTVGLSFMAVAAPAMAVDYVDAAASALQSGYVYVDSGASLSNQSAVSSLGKEANLGVVVLPSGTYTLDPTTMAQQIAAKSPQKSTIVVVDGSKFGVAGPNSAEVTKALYENYQITYDAGEAILKSSDVITATKTISEVGTAPTPDDGGMGVVGGGGIVLALALVGAGVGLGVKKFKARPKAVISDNVLDTVPQELRESIRGLERLLRKYQERGDTSMVENLKSILNHANQLFIRLKKKGTTQSFNSNAIKCADTFNKLALALSEDYYMDILDNQNLWDNSKELILEVRQAVKTTDEELLRSIRQVNNNEDLEFRVVLTQLTKSMNDVPSIQEIMKG